MDGNIIVLFIIYFWAIANPASSLSVTDWDSREFLALEFSTSSGARPARPPPLSTNEADCIFWAIYGSS